MTKWNVSEVLGSGLNALRREGQKVGDELRKIEEKVVPDLQGRVADWTAKVQGSGLVPGVGASAPEARHEPVQGTGAPLYDTIRRFLPVEDAAQLAVDDSAARAMVSSIRMETGMRRPLDGKRFVVITEATFIPEEAKAYAVMIRELGGKVEFASRLWNNPALTFDSGAEEGKDIHRLVVSKDIDQDILPHLGDYDGVIFSANYTMKRLNFTERAPEAQDSRQMFHVYQTTPLARLVDAVMKDPRLVKAFNCHAIWALMTHPEFAQDLRMAYNPVLEGEAHGLGIQWVPVPKGTDLHQHTFADRTEDRGTVVSSAAGVLGGTEAMVRTMVNAMLEQARAS